MSLSQFKSVSWAQVKHWPQGRSRPAGGWGIPGHRFGCRRKVTAPGGRAWLLGQCCGRGNALAVPARAGRCSGVHGSFGQTVSWAEVERRLEHRGWVSWEEGILLGQEESPRGQWLVQPGGRSWWLGARLVGQQCCRAHVQQDTGFGAVPCGSGGHRRQHTALP